MNKKIIVAGAGHGGLVAAYNLALKGYDVTVFEKAERKDLGHDWLDTLGKYIFKDCNLPEPPEEVFGEYETAVFNSPYKTTAVGQRGRVRKSLAYADRIWLINYLIDNCLSAGVEIKFGCGVSAPVTEGTRVTGIELENGEKVYAPLVIDACGMKSPLREKLPSSFGIQNIIPEKDIFYVYRAYFNYLPSEMDPAKYNIYFFNCGRMGLDWVIREKEAADILVGGFGSLNMEEVNTALKGFREMFDFIGTDIVRGGQIKTIPVRKTLSKIIADGYALVGDSASMVEPLSGSGINLSFYGGKLLADTVAGLNSDTYTTQELWPYQYNYYAKHGNGQIQPEILKGMLTGVTCDDIEYLFTSRFLTDKELGGTGEKKTAGDIFDKVKSVVCRPSIVPALLRTAKKLASIKKVCSMMPDKYNSDEIERWRKAYDKL